MAALKIVTFFSFPIFECIWMCLKCPDISDSGFESRQICEKPKNIWNRFRWMPVGLRLLGKSRIEPSRVEQTRIDMNAIRHTFTFSRRMCRKFFLLQPILKEPLKRKPGTSDLPSTDCDELHVLSAWIESNSLSFSRSKQVSHARLKSIRWLI